MTALVIAVCVQWVLLAVLCVGLVVLLRQVGMLHERLGPVGALTLPGGPKAGDAAPQMAVRAMDGRTVTVGGAHAAGRSTLLFFLSPTCSVCKTLIPVVKGIAHEERETLDVVLASDGDEPLQQRMVSEQGLAAFPLLLSTDLGLAYHVSKLPYAVLIAPDGTVAAKGLVNNREHLESLFEARRQGVASLQQYLNRERAIPEGIETRTVA
ncbi:redoxin family protein [Sphingomonas flavalba]|uniref:redoxin family protein n=1 Tax=Sphingomonas flavalba TaxID=2559804 RepID=UPI0039E15385